MTNFMYHDDVIKLLPKLLDYKGVINVGGKSQSVFNFVKKSNSKIKAIVAKKNQIPLNSTMNISKLIKITK